MPQTFVIVGNGVAAVTAAATLADAAPGSQILLYTDEKYPYYRRPWLPDFLAGHHEVDELYAYPPAWYEKRHIQVHLGAKVTAIDIPTQTVSIASGQSVPYDKLLLAGGGNSFVPPISNTTVRGVFTLRTLDDALAIRDYARGIPSAVVVGGGLLGLEAARGLKGLGLSVTVIEVFPRLLPRQLDEEGAAVLTQLMEQMKIAVVTGASVEAVTGEGQATGVQLKSGKTYPGGLVLFSAGIRPNLELPRRIGLAVNRGVVADEHMRTSAPDIFVAGDMAEFKERVYGIIPAAIEQARVAAANMISPASASYAGTTPINTLKVMGIDLTSIGLVNPEEPGYTAYRRSDTPTGLYKKLVFKDGALVGAILLGDRKAVTPMTRLVNRKAAVEAQAAQMLEDGFDFKPLL